MTIPHIPLHRFGEAYESLDTVTVSDHRDGSALATLSQANPGLIRRDKRRLAAANERFKELPYREVIELCKRAGEHLLADDLPVDANGTLQSPDDYVRWVTAARAACHDVQARQCDLPDIGVTCWIV